jgi:hypothetical protein
VPAVHEWQADVQALLCWGRGHPGAQADKAPFQSSADVKAGRCLSAVHLLGRKPPRKSETSVCWLQLMMCSRWPLHVRNVSGKGRVLSAGGKARQAMAAHAAVRDGRAPIVWPAHVAVSQERSLACLTKAAIWQTVVLPVPVSPHSRAGSLNSRHRSRRQYLWGGQRGQGTEMSPLHEVSG